MACRFRIKFQVYSDGSPAPSSSAAAKDDEPPLPTFTLFSALPPELRLKIWDFAASVPRIVLASCITQGLDAEGEGDQGATEQQQLRELSSRRACRFVPAVLHANHESRTRALEQHYSLTFSWKVPHVFASTYHHQNQNSNSHDRLPTSGEEGVVGGGPPTWSQPRVYFNFERDALYLLGELEPYDSFGFNSPMTYFLRKEDTARVRCVAVAFSALKYGETGSQQIFGSLFHVVDRFPLCSTATPAPTPMPTAASSSINGNSNGGSSNGNTLRGDIINGGGGSSSTVAGVPDQQQPHVLVCVTPGDEWTHALLGGTEPLVKGHRGEWEQQRDFGHMPQSQRNQERQQRRQQQQQNPGNNLGEQYEEEETAEEPEPENVVQKIWTDWYRGSIVKSRMADVRFKLITEDELERAVTGQPSANTTTNPLDGSDSRRDDYKELHDALGKYLHGAA
ncbi:hypothetical protein PG999_001941 [Apiospora kogelbergensis]|uniref:2EXR domain-containing protein n=1 Tax=Apiospora kogelbergensis TaxID=1337665 RepID=A0AAW0R6Y7_9PEZI